MSIPFVSFWGNLNTALRETPELGSKPRAPMKNLATWRMVPEWNGPHGVRWRLKGFETGMPVLRRMSGNVVYVWFKIYMRSNNVSKKTYDFSLCHLIRCVPSWRHSWNNFIFSNWFFKTAKDSFHSDELSAFETTQASIDECVQREWSAKLSQEQCLDLANLEGKISGPLSACVVSRRIPLKFQWN